ncbi:gp004R [Rabbit fibroma virus]|uniref:T4 protein n=1 Tax=Rabbit fibroma virus (strain Kasza) TaxID=10272 RepID=VT4_RFVKA|nr:gp004L [Rabbit fibroma virus]NP_052046.1 gp004R [Rabbit fibroma virus]P25948.2 RecName: Full=T4 protein [Rabbit fibroma virus (strain Kasza)]AAF17887.1 gp004L [Rabbit fibroma virus]AAF18040.1 gp004R [Rabbit fibroma virus]
MESVVLLLAFISLVCGYVIDPCTPQERSTWHVSIKLCIRVQEYKISSRGCRLTQGPGGLIATGNGFKIFAYDECGHDEHSFLLTNIRESVYASGHGMYAEISNNVTYLDLVSPCARNITIIVSCDDITINAYGKNIDELHPDVTITTLIDTSCVRGHSFAYSINTLCTERLSGESCEQLACQAIKGSQHENYLKACELNAPEQYMFKEYKPHQRPHVAKVLRDEL